MAVPPRGDPRRPLHLAASSCRLLGVLGLLATTCLGIGLFVTLTHLRLGPGGRGPNPLAVALPVVLCGTIGVAYLVVAHHMKRRRFWAVVAALALTGVVTLVDLISITATTVAALTLPGGLPPSVLAFTGVELLVLLALGQLIYHLTRSFPALKFAPLDEARGFDVLPVPAVPVEGPDADSQAG